MSKYAAAPDPSPRPAGKAESPVIQPALRIIRLTRVSDTGLNLLACAAAIEMAQAGAQESSTLRSGDAMTAVGDSATNTIILHILPKLAKILCVMAKIRRRYA